MAQDSTTEVPDEGQLCWLAGGDRITEAEVMAQRAQFSTQALDDALRPASGRSHGEGGR